MATGSLTVPLGGDLHRLRAALHDPPDRWIPGVLLMHSPDGVAVRLRMLGASWDVDVLVDGPDVRPVEDRRRLVIRARQRWLPEVTGVVEVEEATGPERAARRPELRFSWTAADRQVPLGPLRGVLGRAIVRAVIPEAARLLQRQARRGP